jgi:allophanate hydrolase subunit 1
LGFDLAGVARSGALEPILLRPGDRLRFRPIGRNEYDRIAAAVAARSYRPVIA